MHCTSQGSGEEAVLFIHGMPTNSRLWDSIVRHLVDGHRCLTIDLPGLGNTPSAPYGPNYLHERAVEIEAVRLKFGIESWHIVGHDAGSAIAVYYAASFPDRVRSLALLSPAIFPDLRPFYLLQALRRRVLGELLAPFIHLLFWRVAMRRALSGNTERAAFRAFHAPFAGPRGGWKLMRLVRWGKPGVLLSGIPAMLESLPMPTLIFHGTHDILPADFAQRALGLIPKARLVSLDAGHFSPLDRPNDIAAGLTQLFAETRTQMSIASL